jgi:3',5'-nucleoside bisphosphate phosphatase
MSTTRTPHYDLHSHSTCSDGVLRPAELVERAAKRGVKALALTDHDELSGLAEARAAADRCGIQLIPGVEISVTWRGHTLHIVGLHVDPQSEVLVSGLNMNRARRNERAVRIGEALERLGVPDALEGARSYVTNPNLVSRTHFARYLVATGWARNTQAVFDKYLGAGRPGYVEHDWTTLEEAVEWIAAAGGVSVLAHPGRYKLTEPQRDELLGSFKELRGFAIEVVTGSHTPDEFGYWARRAKQYGFFGSAGSDFHGLPDTYRDLGDLPPLPDGCTPVWQLFEG